MATLEEQRRDLLTRRELIGASGAGLGLLASLGFPEIFRSNAGADPLPGNSDALEDMMQRAKSTGIYWPKNTTGLKVVPERSLEQGGLWTPDYGNVPAREVIGAMNEVWNRVKVIRHQQSRSLKDLSRELVGHGDTVAKETSGTVVPPGFKYLLRATSDDSFMITNGYYDTNGVEFDREKLPARGQFRDGVEIVNYKVAQAHLDCKYLKGECFDLAQILCALHHVAGIGYPSVDGCYVKRDYDVSFDFSKGERFTSSSPWQGHAVATYGLPTRFASTSIVPVSKRIGHKFWYSGISDVTAALLTDKSSSTLKRINVLPNPQNLLVGLKYDDVFRARLAALLVFKNLDCPPKIFGKGGFTGVEGFNDSREIARMRLGEKFRQFESDLAEMNTAILTGRLVA